MGNGGKDTSTGYPFSLKDSIIKQEIMKAISRLAKGINSEIVAEGIETEAEYNTLKDLNIRYGQGYLFAKPSDKLCTIRKKF